MGLSSSQEIWDIIHSITQNQPKRDIWHPAFPKQSIEIPILLNGKSIESTAKQIYKKSKQTPGTYSVWICGPIRSGKTYAVRQIKKEIDHIAKQKNEQSISIQIHKIENVNHESARSYHSFSLSYWGKREFSSLLHSLHTSLTHSQYAIGQAFIEKYDVFQQQIRLYAYDAIFLFRMIIDGGIPQSETDLRIRLMKYFWNLSMEHGFDRISLSLEDWSYIWGGIFSVACIRPKIPHHELHAVMAERCSSFALINRSVALQKIQEMTEAPKKERERLALEVSRWLVQSSSTQLLQILVQERLIIKNEKYSSVSFQQRMMLWAAYSYVQKSRIELPHSYLLHQDWSKFLSMMMVLKLSKETLQQWLDRAPSFLWLEVYLVRLRYALHFDEIWSESELVDIWGHVLYTEYHQRYMVHEPRNFERSEALIAFSKKYAQILPQLSYEDPINDILSLVSSRLHDQLEINPSLSYRPIQALAPYQLPPKNYMQWKMWKRISNTGPKGWEVLSYFAHKGKIWAQRLLSEGDGSSSAPWIYAPVHERMSFVGRSDIRVETKRAIHNICVDIWQNKPHSQPSWEPDAAQILLDACVRCTIDGNDFEGWIQLSSIAQQIIRYRQPFLAYCTIWFLYRTKHHEKLEEIYRTLYLWCKQGIHIEDGMLQQSGFMIPMGNSSQEEVQQELRVLLLRTAEVLYSLGELNYVFDIWKENQFALEKEAFNILIRNYDRDLILYWLSISPMVLPSMNQALCSDGKYLRLAWRLDRTRKRKKELYSFALTYSSLPQWTLQDAQKTLQESSVWPHWLSPHRIEVQDMLIGMTKKAQGRHKLWFGAIIHRHIPNHSIFLNALKQWALEDKDPLSYSSRGGQSYLSATSSPLHSSLELLQLLLSLSERPSWFVKACCRLWRFAHKKNEKIALKLLFVMEEIEAFSDLFREDWYHCPPALQKEITGIWVKQQSPSSIIDMYWKEASIRPYLQREVLSLRDPKFMAWLKEDFANNLNVSSFELLLEGDSKELPTILSDICDQKPKERERVLIFVQQYLLRHHHLGLMLWLKEEMNRV
ncbi:MAG: hypothetical protein CL916_01980 [Deltaproteobacteria bacterium]|nr:hypothetical protein [Deltaproteobacteria bacterium]